VGDARFAVCEPTEPVGCGVEIHVAAAFALHLQPVSGLGALAPAAVDTPTSAVGDPADLLHIDVDHVAWPPGADPAGLPVRFAVRVDELAMVEPEPRQLPGHCAAADGDALSLEFERDPRR
jgi:hypothetical protein